MDIREIGAEELTHFEDGYYSQELGDFLGAYDNDRLVGIVGGIYYTDYFIINNLWVLEEYRRQGIGTDLILAMEAYAFDTYDINYYLAEYGEMSNSWENSFFFMKLGYGMKRFSYSKKMMELDRFVDSGLAHRFDDMKIAEANIRKVSDIILSVTPLEKDKELVSFKQTAFALMKNGHMSEDMSLCYFENGKIQAGIVVSGRKNVYTIESIYVRGKDKLSCLYNILGKQIAIFNMNKEKDIILSVKMKGEYNNRTMDFSKTFMVDTGSSEDVYLVRKPVRQPYMTNLHMQDDLPLYGEET